MKNSKQYAERIRKLYNSLKRKGPKPRKPPAEDPTEALVFAIVREQLPSNAARTAFNKLKRHFVDFNDLRVARKEEVLDVLGRDNPAHQTITERLSKALQHIFNKHNSVSLAHLTETGKRPARQALETIDGATPFVINYVSLVALDAHAIPLTDYMIEYLKNNELVHPSADAADIEGFLLRQIAAARALDFFHRLSRESEKKSARRGPAKSPPKSTARTRTQKRKKSTTKKRTKEKTGTKTKRKTKTKPRSKSRSRKASKKKTRPKTKKKTRTKRKSR